VSYTKLVSCLSYLQRSMITVSFHFVSSDYLSEKRSDCSVFGLLVKNLLLMCVSSASGLEQNVVEG